LANETTLLLDLDGVSVIRVERCEDGCRRAHLATAEPRPGLGPPVRSSRPG
jgi:hypothetical protein